MAAEKGAGGAAFFDLSSETFSTTVSFSDREVEGVSDLIEEILEWRLAKYLDRRPRFRVIQNSRGNPIVKIDRKTLELPSGWVEVDMDGTAYELKFVKRYVNVARVSGEERNVLPEILRSWFGEDAGAPGGLYEINHTQDAEGLIRGASSGSGSARTAAGVQIRQDDGEPLDARFSFHEVHDEASTASIAFMSRGAGRNNDYNAGLELLLRRLAERSASITGIWVESGATKAMAASERKLEVDGQPFPIELGSVGDLKKLRAAVGRAAAAVGRRPGARGAGNATKKLRIEVGAADGSAVDLAYLAGGR